MPELKGSKTEENLKEAFAGESQANRRYLYFAQKADVEGYPDVAALFRSVAEGETGEVLLWGSGAAEIVGVRLLDAGGAERYHFESGEAVTFELEAEAARPLEDFVFGVGLFSPRGVEVWGTNTDIDGLASERFAGRAKVALECPSLRLAPGEYLVDVAVHAQDGAPYDYRRKLLAFSVTSTAGGAGVYLPEHRWRFAGASGTVSFQRSRHE